MEKSTLAAAAPSSPSLTPQPETRTRSSPLKYSILFFLAALASWCLPRPASLQMYLSNDQDDQLAMDLTNYTVLAECDKINSRFTATHAPPFKEEFPGDFTSASREYMPYVRQPVLYGHLHMAKTAGTNLNGQVAHNFERVCGHKGYSYDSYTTNNRFIAKNVTNIQSKIDMFGKLKSGHSRARVPPSLMQEIGFEDCDWVSFEERWSVWMRNFADWDVPLELHVPCRDPIDHLLSQCNHRSNLPPFPCNSNVSALEFVKKCMVFPDRFKMSLTTIENFQVKCFDFYPIRRYIEYMGNKLQWKRPQGSPYKNRETNRQRDKKQECLWRDEHATLRQEVRDFMIQEYDYYNFCNSCKGTKDDLYAG